MWPVVQVPFKPKMKVNYHDQSDRVQFTMKTKQDNNMADCIGAVYTDIRT